MERTSGNARGRAGRPPLLSLAAAALIALALVAGAAPAAHAAVCTNSSAFGSATINPSGALVTISTCSFAGEYSTIFGAVAGQTLQFTSSGTAGNITIHSGTFNGPVIASSGTSPLTFVNTFTGTLFAHWNLTNSCGTDSSCHTTTVQCTSCAAPPPVNDTCAGATTIACGSTTTGNTSTATIDTGFTFCGTSGGTAPGVWYQFTASTTLTTISLCGSSYDTKIHVYDFAPPANCATPASLPCVAGNDDSCGLQSSVTFASVVGRTYKVLVHGFSTQSGAFTMNLTCAAPPPGACTNTIAFGSAPIANSGCPTQAPRVISTCSFAGEYSTITGAVAGQNLTFTDSAVGDQITLRCNAFNGPLIGVPGFGPSPLTVVNTCTGTIFAHWNTPGCGSQSTCRTTTVQWNNRPILCTGVTINGTIQSPINQECDLPLPPLPNLVAQSNAGCPSPATLSLSVSTTPGSCPQNVTITRTWNAQNTCGQQAPSRQQVINISDTTPPVINGVPADSRVECPAPVPARPPVTAVDNCAGPANSPFWGGGPGNFFGSAPDTDDARGTVETINPEKLRQAHRPGPSPNTINIQCQSPNDVCGPAGCNTEYTAPPGQNFGNPDNWNYHAAACTPGASVTVQVNRTDIDMDPAMSICSGNLCGNSNAGWGFGLCPAGSVNLGTGDDNNGEPCFNGSGPFSDPLVTFICPASGLFTMGVFDFLGTPGGEPWNYNLGGTGCTSPAAPCNSTLTFSEVTTPGNCPANFTVVRTWTARDCCNNSSVDTQTIIHEDTIAPVLTDGALEPFPALPPGAPASACSAPTSGGFKVKCSTAEDDCDGPGVGTTAEISVSNVDVVGGVCVPREEVFTVACDEIIEVRLAAAPCPASSMAAPTEARSVHSGVQIFTGVTVKLHETGTDLCGNVGNSDFDPAAGTFPNCPLLSRPPAVDCPGGLCPTPLRAGAPADREKTTTTVGRSRGSH